MFVLLNSINIRQDTVRAYLRFFSIYAFVFHSFINLFIHLFIYLFNVGQKKLHVESYNYTS